MSVVAVPAEIAPSNLWRRHMKKDEAIMYMFMLKGWRFPTSGNLVFMHETGVPLGIWIDNMVSDSSYDNECFKIIPVRDL